MELEVVTLNSLHYVDDFEIHVTVKTIKCLKKNF